MIKPHEITIGSLLRTNKGEIIKVESISTKRQNRKVGYHDSVCRLKYIRLANCEGIPLTEEILKANGFEETNTGFMVEFFQRPSYVMKLNESYYYGIEVVGGYCNIRAKNEEYKNLPFEADIQCNYVHELQTVLRLCGLNELADNFKVEASKIEKT